MATTTKILVCSHKEDYVRNDSIYMPIQVGKVNATANLGFQGDDSGENISYKNLSYCELTALYWAWKNLKKVDYIGLCHYRRYFDFSKSGLATVTPDIMDKIISYPDVKLFEKYDVVLPQPIPINCSVFSFYNKMHPIEDMLILTKVIQRMTPEYYTSWKDYIRNVNHWIPCNMFLCKRELLCEYSGWLFPLLEELEKWVRLSPYSYQKRIYGFLGEILLPFYCYHHKLRILHRPIVFVGDSIVKRKVWKTFIAKYVSNISFILGRIVDKEDLHELTELFHPYMKRDGIIIE